MKYLKKFNENMEYTTIFGKEVSHNEALEKRIRDCITSIVVEELGISEKAFQKYDNVMEKVKELCDNKPEIYEDAQNYYENNKRLELLAEIVYDKYFGYHKIEEKLSIEEKRTDVKGKVERSKKLSKEMKDKISPLLTTETEYNNGRVFRLKGFSNKGCDLGADKNGFFCFTHRARSKSYESPDKIPQKDINFIESTG